MDKQTKEALKQMQAEMRQLQTLIADQKPEHKPEVAPDEPQATGKSKSETKSETKSDGGVTL